MFFRRKPKNRRFEREYVLDVKLRSGQVRAARNAAELARLERSYGTHDAQAALRLVLAQPAIGSQMIDSLNASIHLRALLTDLFLIDEILTISGE